jgi:NAD(P)-dependent dehydrogenase (short-subunit alcohol dehydrogenase family)
MAVAAPRRNIVLITGCSSGIGNACCEVLCCDDLVVGASRKETKSDLWTYIPMDITDDASVKNAVHLILSQYGRIDAVVHCAGTSLAGPVEETTISDAQAQFETNYFGTIRILQAVLPIMRSQLSGRIVIIGSIGGLIGLPFQAHYSATKFALDGMIEALRREVSPFGIALSLLHPGNFRTALNQNRAFAQIISSLSAYDVAYEKAVRFYADEELTARPPTLVALKVKRILQHKRPQRQYLIGTPLELIGVYAKRFLPSALFDHLIRIFYFP